MRIRGERIYDDHGMFVGRLRDGGRVVDQYGQLQARVRDGGRMVDPSGQLVGRVRNGRIYDQYGQPLEPEAVFGDR